MSAVKQVIVWRNDLKCRKGKIAAQVAHASLKVILDSMINGMPFVEEELPVVINKILKYELDSDLDLWLSGKFTKIVVYVNNEQELLDIYKKAEDNDLPCSLIKDAGNTEFHGVPTYTCCAIGPASSEKIDPLTGHLKLL